MSGELKNDVKFTLNSLHFEVSCINNKKYIIVLGMPLVCLLLLFFSGGGGGEGLGVAVGGWAEPVRRASSWGLVYIVK